MNPQESFHTEKVEIQNLLNQIQDQCDLNYNLKDEQITKSHVASLKTVTSVLGSVLRNVCLELHNKGN